MLLLIAEHPRWFVTDPEVLQELVHRYVASGSRALGASASIREIEMYTYLASLTKSPRKRPLALGATTILTVGLLAILSAVANGGPPTAAQAATPATGNIQVRDGTNPGEVIISWDHVPQATHYRIGYVNMVTDYPLAKASVTGDWINAFIYVDENARNVPVSNGRAEYTVRRLEQNVRHAFTVLTSNRFTDTGDGGSVNSAFSWPSNPRWKFHKVADRGGACPMSCPGSQPIPPPTQGDGTILIIPPLSNQDCYVGLQLTPGESCIWPDPTNGASHFAVVGISDGGDYHGRTVLVWYNESIWIGQPDDDRTSWSTIRGRDNARRQFRMERGTGDTWTVTVVNEIVPPPSR